MNELVCEWVEKAEGDVRTAEREARVTEGPNWDKVNILHSAFRKDTLPWN